MSDEQQETQEPQGDTGGIAQLRQQYEELKKQNAEKDRQLAEFQATQRTNTLKSAFGEAKVRDGLTRFYPADAEVSKEAVEKWARENAEAFGLTFDDNSAETQAQNQQVASEQQRQQAASAQTGRPPIEVGSQEEYEKFVSDPSHDPVWLMEQGLIPDIRAFVNA